jgi:hypothetical protein
MHHRNKRSRQSRYRVLIAKAKLVVSVWELRFLRRSNTLHRGPSDCESRMRPQHNHVQTSR